MLFSADGITPAIDARAQDDVTLAALESVATEEPASTSSSSSSGPVPPRVASLPQAVQQLMSALRAPAPPSTHAPPVVSEGCVDDGAGVVS